MRQPSGCQLGFTLVELLVVIAIFGVFAGAVYSLYIAHMKTAFQREEVMDVQQNVRIAMDRLTRDLRMAGFLVTPAVEKSMSNYSTISIQTASADSTFVAISNVIQDNSFSVAPAAVLANFQSGTDKVAIIRPATRSQIGGIFSVVSSSSASGRMGISPPAAADTLRVGDMVCKASTYPDRVRYRINRSDTTQGCDKSPCLTRNNEIIAQGIVSVRFDYLLDGSSNDPKTDASVLSDDDLRKLTAVRVTVTGQTSKKSGPDDAVKSRELRSLIKLRNYK